MRKAQIVVYAVIIVTVIILSFIFVLPSRSDDDFRVIATSKQFYGGNEPVMITVRYQIANDSNRSLSNGSVTVWVARPDGAVDQLNASTDDGAFTITYLPPNDMFGLFLAYVSQDMAGPSAVFFVDSITIYNGFNVTGDNGTAIISVEGRLDRAVETELSGDYTVECLANDGRLFYDAHCNGTYRYTIRTDSTGYLAVTTRAMDNNGISAEYTDMVDLSRLPHALLPSDNTSGDTGNITLPAPTPMPPDDAATDTGNVTMPTPPPMPPDDAATDTGNVTMPTPPPMPPDDAATDGANESMKPPGSNSSSPDDPDNITIESPSDNSLPSTLSWIYTAYEPITGLVWKTYNVTAPMENVSLTNDMTGILPDDTIVAAARVEAGHASWLEVAGGEARDFNLSVPGSRLDIGVEPSNNTTAYLESAYGLSPDATAVQYSWDANPGNLLYLLNFGMKADGVRYRMHVPIPANSRVLSVVDGNGTAVEDNYTDDNNLYLYSADSPSYMVELSEPAFVESDGFGPLNVTNQPWPQNSDWISWVNLSWQPVRAPTYDKTPNYIDISSGGLAKPLAGPNNSIYVYYNTSSRFLFCRMLLSANPYSGGSFYNYMWGLEIDNNGDGWADWATFLEGATSPETISVGYNTRGHTNQLIDYFIYTQDANPALGFTRVVTDGQGLDSNQMYFLDWQTPLAAFSVSSAFAPDNITENTTIRMFFGTSTVQNTFNRDILGQAAINFSIGPNMTIGGLGNGVFGRLNDTRDPNPPSNQGTWNYSESVRVSGSGWPVNNPGMINLTIRVINATGTIFNTTTISYSTTTGIVTNASIWNIPANGSPAPGIYGIWVKNPGSSPEYRWYDNFTLWDNIPPVVSNVTVIPPIVASGGRINITANVTDNYRIANVTASFAAVTINLTYNSSSGLYENSTTAPIVGGTYNVTVRAYDTYGNTGQNTSQFTVAGGYQRVSKFIVWNITAGRYNVSLNVTNMGTAATVTAYDFIPPGQVASVGGIYYPGPANINFSRYMIKDEKWYINYTISPAVNVYQYRDMCNSGLR